MQKDDNRAIAYASRVLTGPESRYPVTHLEALAIVWSLRHFRDLIYGYDILCSQIIRLFGISFAVVSRGCS